MSDILIVEDEPVIRQALRKLLERNQYQVDEAGSVAEACEQDLDSYQLIISDLRLPGKPGTDLIQLAQNTPVLMMTSYASLRSAVDSMKLGAVDYIAKPFSHSEMLAAVDRIIASKSRQPKTSANTSYKNMIGSSPQMKAVYHRIDKVAPTDATVLINGETGTGKELAAKAIHNASKRANAPLISINCAAIPETLIESELFGHAKGAFTGADSFRDGLVVAADNGTLFLDEIGELPTEAQARLLRVLQEGEVRPVGSVSTRKVNILLIAATHRDLAQLCKEGQFREDLFFRLNVFQLQLPPLRERGKDVLSIAESIIARYSEQYQKVRPTLSPEAVQAITTYTWPGNIRELENALQRAIIFTEDGEPISYESLSIDLALVPIGDNSDNVEKVLAKIDDPSELEHYTQDNLSLEDYFQRFVIENQENMSETELAQKLGVSRKCLWERRQKFGIPRKKGSIQK